MARDKNSLNLLVGIVPSRKSIYIYVIFSFAFADEPFTIAVKTKPNEHVELKIAKEGNSTPFLGRSNSNELSYLPNIIRVDRATADDEGVFSWSLLSNLETTTGTIEIIVHDKGIHRTLLHVQHGSETHLREVPIYVKLRIVTS